MISYSPRTVGVHRSRTSPLSFSTSGTMISPGILQCLKSILFGTKTTLLFSSSKKLIMSILSFPAWVKNFSDLSLNMSTIFSMLYESFILNSIVYFFNKTCSIGSERREELDLSFFFCFIGGVNSLFPYFRAINWVF